MVLELEGFEPLIENQVYLEIPNNLTLEKNKADRCVLLSINRADHRYETINDQISRSMHALGVELSDIPSIGKSREFTRAEKELLGSDDVDLIYPYLKQTLESKFESVFNSVYGNFKGNNSEVGVDYSIVTSENRDLLKGIAARRPLTKKEVDDYCSAKDLTDLGFGIQARVYLALGLSGENVERIKKTIDLLGTDIGRTGIINVFDHESRFESSLYDVLQTVNDSVLDSNILSELDSLEYQLGRTTDYRVGKILRVAANRARSEQIIRQSMSDFEEEN